MVTPASLFCSIQRLSVETECLAHSKCLVNLAMILIINSNTET